MSDDGGAWPNALDRQLNSIMRQPLWLNRRVEPVGVEVVDHVPDSVRWVSVTLVIFATFIF